MEKHETVEDGNMSVFRFDNGLIAQIHTSFLVKYAGDGIEIHGTEGSISINDFLGRESSGPVILKNADGEQHFNATQHSIDEKTINFFVDAIKGGTKPGCTGEDGERSLAAAIACLESAKTGKCIKI